MPLIDPTWRELTGTERDFLVVLAHNGASTSATVADCLGVTEGQATRVRHSLESKGLVRTENADGRTLSIDVTDDGQALVGDQFGGGDP